MWKDNPRFNEVPSFDHTIELGRHMGTLLLPAYVDGDVRGVVEHLGWRLSDETVRRESSIRSLLIPLLKGGFSVVLNETVSTTGDERLRLVGHEIAHSFFYASDNPPRRIIPLSDAEEMFCDHFADIFSAHLLDNTESL